MQFSRSCRPYWLRRTQRLPSNNCSMPLSSLCRYVDRVNSVIGAVTETLGCLISLIYGVQIKEGDPREAASLASALLTSGQPLEVLHFGFQLLQAVVGPHTGHLNCVIPHIASEQEASHPGGACSIKKHATVSQHGLCSRE